TRYAGTAMAVPSIWAGGLVPRILEQPQFLRRNLLMKLLDANRYLRIMDVDHVVEGLVPRDDSLVELDRGKGTMEFDLCGTLSELQQRLPRDRARPLFFYSLPQNVHIAVAMKRKVPADESYPPEFDEQVASSVHRVDECLGRFVEALQRDGLYENSVI